MRYAVIRMQNAYYLIEILAKVGLAVAGAFAVYQFMESRESERVSRSMTYIEYYERGGIADARRIVRNSMRPYLDQFVELARSGLGREDREAMIMTIMEDPDNSELPDAIELIVDFYEGLKLCTFKQLCSESVTLGYFCPATARELWENFEPYFISRRTNNTKFAESLEWCALLNSAPASI